MAILKAEYNIGDSFYYIERDRIEKAVVIAILFEENGDIDYKLRKHDGDKVWINDCRFAIYSSTEDLIEKIKKECEKFKITK